MTLLAAIHQAAVAIGAAGGLYAASVALAVVTSLMARSRELRDEARKTLKILLRHKR